MCIGDNHVRLYFSRKDTMLLKKQTIKLKTDMKSNVQRNRYKNTIVLLAFKKNYRRFADFKNNIHNQRIYGKNPFSQ